MVHNDFERLLTGRWNEVAREEIELRIRHGELVLAALIPPMQSCSAKFVWYVQIMELVCASCTFE
jgi:hypothetical protein